jgi:hypothetical protein
MSSSHLWLAFRGVECATLYQRLNLQPATESDPEIWGSELPGGWFLITGNGFGLSYLDDSMMNQACLDSFAVSSFSDDRYMCSSTAAWKGGRMSWSVIHQGEEGTEHLETVGELPPEFAQIFEEQSAKQKTQGSRPRIDFIFDVPIKLAAVLTGFHPDHGTSAGYPDLHPLELAVLPNLPPEYWMAPARPASWFTPIFG